MEFPTLDTMLDGPITWDGYGPITVTRTGHPGIRGGGTFDVTIVLPDSGIVAEVTAYGPSIRFGEEYGPQVNWPTFGSRTPTDVSTFAALLACAAHVAGLAEGPAES